MPWTIDNPPPPARKKSIAERRACVAAANASLKDHPDDEKGAVMACIGAMQNVQKMRKAADHVVSFAKTDDELRIVWGEVYVPGIPDSEGDFMTAVEVRKMAHGFLAQGLTNQIDVNHDYNMTSARVVESFIAREGDPDFIPGSWVMATHIPDDDLWAAIKGGELNGYSMAGWSTRADGELHLEIPPFFVGRTVDGPDGHDHAFKVFFDQDGEFLGGETSVDGEHWHVIKRGTVTEPGGDGHVHRFSFVEAFVGKDQGEGS